MQQKEPSLLVSLIPVVLLVILLTLNVIVFKDDSSYGPNQIALLLTSMLCAVIGVFHLKRPYKEFEKKAGRNVVSESNFKEQINQAKNPPNPQQKLDLDK